MPIPRSIRAPGDSPRPRRRASAGRRGSTWYRPSRGMLRPRSPPPPSPRPGRAMGDRLVRRRLKRSPQRARGVEAGHAVILREPTTDAVWPRPRRSRSQRAVCLLVPRDPQRDRPGAHVRRRVERHVLDIDPGALRASASSATVPGRLATPTRSSASCPAADSASSRRRRSVAAAPCQAASASGSPLRISSAASPSRSPSPRLAAATASRLLVKMSPQIVGFDPGDPGRVAKARADLGHPLRVAGQRRRRLARRGRWRPRGAGG